MIFMFMLAITEVGRTSVYDSRRLKKMLDAGEEVNKYILARIDVLSRLVDHAIKMTHTKKSTIIPTRKRTPIPAKITFAGEKT